MADKSTKNDTTKPVAKSTVTIKTVAKPSTTAKTTATVKPASKPASTATPATKPATKTTVTAKPTTTAKPAATVKAASKPASTATPATKPATKTTVTAKPVTTAKPAATVKAASKPASTTTPAAKPTAAAKSAQKSKTTSAENPKNDKSEKSSGGIAKYVATVKNAVGGAAARVIDTVKANKVRAIAILATTLVFIIALILGLSLGLKKKPNAPYEFHTPDTATVLSTTYSQPTNMPYYAEWLDTNYPRQQNVPEKNEGLAKYPVFGTKFNGESAELKQAVFNESMKLVSQDTSYYPQQSNSLASYNMMDENGNLLLNKVDTGMDLYKHTAANGMYFGNVADDEPAVVKRITTESKSYGTVMTGLYAPAGEVVKVEIPKADLEGYRFWITIGQCFGSGPAFVINANTDRSFVRMPVITSRFLVTQTMSYYDETTETYTAYVGSFFGGPIYLLVTPLTSGSACKHNLTITFSGAVNYRHYIHGVTTEEEFEYVSQSSAPYFDLEVSWLCGVRHSGPLKYASMFNYEQLKNVGDIWENIGFVSNQIPNSCPGGGNIVFVYDNFIIKGSAQAITGNRTVCAPYNWLTNALNYELIINNGAWGVMHEYNHHYQKFGLSGDSNEITNNAVNLLEFAMFTDISSKRTLDGGLSGHTANTMPQYGLKCIVNANNAADENGTARAVQSSINTYAAILHNIGAEAFIASAKTGSYAAGYYKNLVEGTHLDMTWFFTDVLNYSIDNIGGADAVKAVKDKKYPVFVPVNTVYQVGRVWKKDGVNQYSRTAQPFIYGTGDYTLDFENYLVIPQGFSYTIKNFTQPVNGSVKRTDGKHLLFKPNDKKLSGEFFVTLEVKKNDGAFKVEDVTFIINLEQANILQRTTWSYTEENKPQVSSADDLISVYEGLKPTDANAVVGNNVNEAQNANTEIWGAYAYSPNSIMEVKGSLYINADGKYRIALRGRRYAALYLSYDGGKTYTDVIQLTYHDSGTDFMPNDYVDVELKNGDWVDFKAVLYVDYTWAYIGVGIGLFGADADGETVSETVNVGYASAYKNEIYLPELYFAPPYRNIFDNNGYTYDNKYSTSQTLVEQNNAESVSENPSFTHANTQNRWLDNLFDEDETNVFWSSGDKSYSAENPFEITVDLGKTVTANRFTIYYPADSGFAQYYPTAYKLYAGVTLDNLTLVYQTDNGGKSNNATVINLDSDVKLRYYKLEVTDAKYRSDKCFALRKLEWSYTATGAVISPHSKANDYYEYGAVKAGDAVVYSGEWKDVTAFSTFGTVYEGTSASEATCEFNGTQFAVQSYCGAEYGSYEIYLDGKLVYTADISDGDGVGLVYISELLDSGKHTVTLKGKSGKFNLDSLILFN